MRRSVPDQQEWRENLAEIYSLIRQQQRILFRTQAVAGALLETLRECRIQDFGETFEKRYKNLTAGKVAIAEELAVTSLDKLIGRLSAKSMGNNPK